MPCQLRFTGSKLATAITAPTMAASTTPPATMLRRKFFSDGEMPGCAASATSGMSSAAANAAVVSPLTAISFADDGDDDARILSWLQACRLTAGGVGSLSGWKKASDPTRARPTQNAGLVKVTAEADAMD